jgi:hypothetical protein
VSGSTSGSAPDTSDPADPHSSFRLEVTLSVGYRRRRALVGTKWEGPIVTLALAIGGVAVVVLFLLLIGRWFGQV